MHSFPLVTKTPYEDETGRLIVTRYDNNEIHIHAELYQEMNKRNYLHWLGVLEEELSFLRDVGEKEVFTVSYNKPDKINFAVCFGFLPLGKLKLSTGEDAIKFRREL